jgi:hypothetical protein
LFLLLIAFVFECGARGVSAARRGDPHGGGGGGGAGFAAARATAISALSPPTTPTGVSCHAIVARMAASPTQLSAMARHALGRACSCARPRPALVGCY